MYFACRWNASATSHQGGRCADLPFINMCVSNTKSPENVMEHPLSSGRFVMKCLPKKHRRQLGKALARAVSNPVTSCPARALLSVREVWNNASPSEKKMSLPTLRPRHRDRYFLRIPAGLELALGIAIEQFVELRLNLLETKGGKKTCKEVFSCCLAVNSSDQQRCFSPLPSDRQLGQFFA